MWGGGGNLMLILINEKMKIRGWNRNAQDIKGKKELRGSVTSWNGSGSADPYL